MEGGSVPPRVTKLNLNNMKELVFIPMGNISEKAKEKLNELRENQNKRIEQMKREFEEGRFTEFLKTL